MTALTIADIRRRALAHLILPPWPAIPAVPAPSG
jgi:hypothetical protein